MGADLDQARERYQQLRSQYLARFNLGVPQREALTELTKAALDVQLEEDRRDVRKTVKLIRGFTDEQAGEFNAYTIVRRRKRRA